MNMITKTPLTVKGAQMLRDELHQLKTVERHAVIQAIAEARALRETQTASQRIQH